MMGMGTRMQVVCKRKVWQGYIFSTILEYKCYGGETRVICRNGIALINIELWCSWKWVLTYSEELQNTETKWKVAFSA